MCDTQVGSLRLPTKHKKLEKSFSTKKTCQSRFSFVAKLAFSQTVICRHNTLCGVCIQSLCALLCCVQQTFPFAPCLSNRPALVKSQPSQAQSKEQQSALSSSPTNFPLLFHVNKQTPRAVVSSTWLPSLDFPPCAWIH